MTPKLWGRASSVNVQKVMWTLAELAIPHTRVDAGGKYGQTDTQEFGDLNPNRKVPVWQEDGLTLWESHAIVRHLAVRGSLSHDAIADQWMEYTTSTLQPAFIRTFWHQVRTPEAERSADKLATLARDLNAALKILDERLSTNVWLDGKTFSTAEISAGALMYRVHDMEWPMSDFPSLRGWYDRLADRSPYRANVMTTYDELRA